MNKFQPNVPFNQLPLLPPKINLDDIDILKATNKANRRLAEFNASLLSLPNPYLFIKPLTVREAVASSQIENINTTVAEVFQAKILPEIEMTKEQKETVHYTEALMAGFELLKRQKFLNTNSYFEIQRTIEPSKAGIRKLSGTAIKNSVTGEVIYTPPEGEQLLRDLLKNYEYYYNEQDSLDPDPLIRMALLHYQFEAIHPFYDGNGRTGRILMVLYLVLQKYIDFPVLFMSGYINQHRQDYYQLLREITEKNIWKNFILFLLHAVEIQALDTISKLLRLKNIEADLKKVLSTEARRSSLYPMIEYLISNPFYNQKHASEAVKMNRKTVADYFIFLEKKGILHRFKIKKYTIYFNKELLKALE
ncbi:MAG TPA: Fic/DOC family N-terminal domain-containing protein [Patescibacteria group bacterium]|nr:Fic/DOC family N-terminal domain-containing protein [Patescibacteria group bacterium]